MAWVTPRTWTYGELVDPTKMATIQSNLNELWKYTTAGDILYATASNSITRLGIGAEGKILTTVGGVPAWGGLANAKANRHNLGSPQTIATGSSVKITFLEEITDTNGFINLGTYNTKVTVPTGFGGTYLVIGYVAFDSANGTKIIHIKKNNSDIQSDVLHYLENYQHGSLTSVELANAGDYFELEVYQMAGFSIGVPTASLSLVKIA